MRVFFQQLINGITIGSTYALVSIGFTMVFGVLELTNFANGSLYMLGAYLSLMLYSATGMNAFLAFFISIILTGGVGYLLDRLALRRLRNKKAPKLTGLITTLGMSMIIDNTIMLAFGSETKPFPNHFDFGRIEIGSVVISWVQIIILATALTLMLILSFVVYKTKIGKAMRCTSSTMLPDAPEQALDEYPMPDPMLTLDDLEKCGYRDGDMLPLSKERAMELYERDLTVYAVVDGGSAEMLFDWEELALLSVDRKRK